MMKTPTSGRTPSSLSVRGVHTHPAAADALVEAAAGDSSPSVRKKASWYAPGDAPAAHAATEGIDSSSALVSRRRQCSGMTPDELFGCLFHPKLVAVDLRCQQSHSVSTRA